MSLEGRVLSTHSPLPGHLILAASAATGQLGPSQVSISVDMKILS